MKRNDQQVSFSKNENSLNDIVENYLFKEEFNPKNSNKNSLQEKRDVQSSRDLIKEELSYEERKEKVFIPVSYNREENEDLQYTINQNERINPSHEKQPLQDLSLNNRELNMQKESIDSEENRNLILNNINQFKTIIDKDNMYQNPDLNNYQFSENNKNNNHNHHNFIDNEGNNFFNNSRERENFNHNEEYSSENVNNSDQSNQDKHDPHKNYQRNYDELDEEYLDDDNKIDLRNDDDQNYDFENQEEYEIDQDEIRVPKFNEGEKANTANEIVNYGVYLQNKSNVLEKEDNFNINQSNVLNFNSNILGKYSNNNELLENENIPKNKSKKGQNYSKISRLEHDDLFTNNDGQQEDISENKLLKENTNRNQFASRQELNHYEKYKDYIKNEDLKNSKIKKEIHSSQEGLGDDVNSERYYNNLNYKNLNVNERENNQDGNYKESEGEDNSLLKSLEEKWEKIEMTRKQKISSYNRKNIQINNDYETINHACDILRKMGDNNSNLKSNMYNQNSNQKSNNIQKSQNHKNFLTLENSEEFQNEISSGDNDVRASDKKMFIFDKSELSDNTNNLNLYFDGNKNRFDKKDNRTNNLSNLDSPNHLNNFLNENDKSNKKTNKSRIYDYSCFGIENSDKKKKSQEEISKGCKETFKSLNNFNDSSKLDFNKLNNDFFNRQIFNGNDPKMNFWDKREDLYSTEEQPDQLDLFIKEKTEILKKLKENINDPKIKLNNEIENIEEEITNENELLNSKSYKDKEREPKNIKPVVDRKFADLKTNARALIDKIFNEESLDNSQIEEKENNNSNIKIKSSKIGKSVVYSPNYKTQENKQKQIIEYEASKGLDALVYEPNLSKNRTQTKGKQDSQQPSFLKKFDENNKRDRGSTEDKNHSMQSSLTNHLNRLNNNFGLSNNNNRGESLNKNIKSNNRYNLNLNDIKNFDNDNSKNFNYSPYHAKDFPITFNNKVFEENKISKHTIKQRILQDIARSDNDKITVPNFISNNMNRSNNYHQVSRIEYCNVSSNKKQEEDRSILSNNRNNNNFINHNANDFQNLNYTNPDELNNDGQKFNNTEFDKGDDIESKNFNTLGYCNHYSTNEDKYLNHNSIKNKNVHMNNLNTNDYNYANLNAKDFNDSRIQEKMKIVYSDICKLNEHNMRTLNINDKFDENSNSNYKNIKINSEYCEKENYYSNINNISKNLNNISNSTKNTNCFYNDFRNNSNFNKDYSILNVKMDCQGGKTIKHTLHDLEKNFQKIFSGFSPNRRENLDLSYKSDLKICENFNKIKHHKNNQTLNDLRNLNSLHNLPKERKDNSLLINNMINPNSSKNLMRSYNSYYNDHLYNINLKGSKNLSLKETFAFKNLERQNRESSLDFKNQNVNRNKKIIDKINQNVDLIESIFDNRKTSAKSPPHHNALFFNHSGALIEKLSINTLFSNLNQNSNNKLFTFSNNNFS